MTRLFLLALAVFALGWASGRQLGNGDYTAADPVASPPAFPAPAAAPGSSPEPTPVAPVCDDAALRAQVEALRVRLETAQAAAADMEARWVDAFGEPLPWPSGTEGMFGAAQVEHVLQGALDQLGEGSLLGTDCGEYPCLAAIAFPEADGDMREARALRDLLRDTPYGAHLRGDSWSIQGADGGTASYILFVAVPAGPLDAQAAKRVDFRLKDAQATFAPDRAAMLEAYHAREE